MLKREIKKHFRNRFLTLDASQAVMMAAKTIARWGILEYGDLQQVCRISDAHLRKAVDLEMIIRLVDDRKKYYLLGLCAEELFREMAIEHNHVPLDLTVINFRKIVGFTKFCVKNGLKPSRTDAYTSLPLFGATNQEGYYLLCAYDMDKTDDTSLLIDISIPNISGAAKRDNADPVTQARSKML